MEPYLGMIAIFGFNFAPVGWAICAGQLMPISQYSALFSLLGTYYGGDGINNFALPDLRGRIPLGMGQGLGLANYVIGEVSGTENTTLTINNMPMHSHPITINASADQGDTSAPANAFPANTGVLDAEYKSSLTNGVTMNPGMATAGISGGSQPFSIMQPFLVINYCIALEGVYPSRS